MSTTSSSVPRRPTEEARIEARSVNSAATGSVGSALAANVACAAQQNSIKGGQPSIVKPAKRLAPSLRGARLHASCWRSLVKGLSLRKRGEHLPESRLYGAVSLLRYIYTAPGAGRSRLTVIRTEFRVLTV